MVLRLGGQRMVEGDVHRAVAVFDVEHHGVSAQLMPPPDNADAVVAPRHRPGKINSAHFEIFRHRHRVFHDRLTLVSGNNKVFARLQSIARGLVVRLAQRALQLCARHVRRVRNVLPHHRGNALTAFHRVMKCGWRRGCCSSGGRGRLYRRSISVLPDLRAGEAAAAHQSRDRGK